MEGICDTPLSASRWRCWGSGSPPPPCAGRFALEPGNSLQRALTDDQSHEYRLQLRAGEYARVVVDQRSVDVSVICLGPDGNEIFSLDSNVIGEPETVEWIADIEGPYRLRITAAPHSPEGEYAVTLREIQLPPSGTGLGCS